MALAVFFLFFVLRSKIEEGRRRGGGGYGEERADGELVHLCHKLSVEALEVQPLTRGRAGSAYSSSVIVAQLTRRSCRDEWLSGALHFSGVVAETLFASLAPFVAGRQLASP